MKTIKAPKEVVKILLSLEAKEDAVRDMSTDLSTWIESAKGGGCKLDTETLDFIAWVLSVRRRSYSLLYSNIMSELEKTQKEEAKKDKALETGSGNNG